MPKHRFDANHYAEIDERPYRYRGHVHGRLDLVDMETGHPYVEPGPNGVVGLIDDVRFAQLVLAGRAKIRSLATNRLKLLRECDRATIEQAMRIDPGVDKMLAQVELLDAARTPKGNVAIGKALKRLWTPALQAKYGDHDPPATIRHWRRVRGAVGRRHPSEFVREWGRVDRGPYRPEAIQALLAKHIGLGKAGREARRSGYAAFAAEIAAINEGRHPEFEKPEVAFRIPHPGTWSRWWNLAHDEKTVEAQLGEGGALQSFRGAGRPLTAEYAMHRVIIDHTRLNLWAVVVLDDGEIVAVGRPWLTVAIDVRTRAIVAHLISFIPPCGWTLGEILRRMVLPKRPPAEEAAKWPILTFLGGRPTEVFADNATEFRSHSAERAFRASGVGLRFRKLAAPRYAAIVERVVQTLNKLVCEGVPGATMPIAEAKRVGYDPQAEAVAELGQIEGMTNLAVAGYNVHPHKGVRNRQPALLFQKDAEERGIATFADLDDVMRDFMQSVQGHQLTFSGIEWKRLRFHGDSEVIGLLNDVASMLPAGRRRRNGDATAEVDFVYDPHDISRIHVWNPRSREYVTLLCDEPEYSDGMPLFVHDMILAAAERDADAFGTEEERLVVRDRLVQAKRHLDPDQTLKQRETAMRLMEAPRLRQIAGNVVHLHTAPVQPVCAYDLIPSERAAMTAFDVAVATPRPEPRVRPKRVSRRDRRDAGQSQPQAEARTTAKPAAATRPSRRRTVAGRYS